MHLALHERDRTPRYFRVDEPSLFEIVNLYVTARLALASLHDLRRRHDVGRITG
jgi:hypothetical protein